MHQQFYVPSISLNSPCLIISVTSTLDLPGDLAYMVEELWTLLLEWCGTSAGLHVTPTTTKVINNHQGKQTRHNDFQRWIIHIQKGASWSTTITGQRIESTLYIQTLPTNAISLFNITNGENRKWFFFVLWITAFLIINKNNQLHLLLIIF